MNPMKSYVPGDGLVGAPFGGWMVSEMLGQPVYTNGHFILAGEPPTPELDSRRPTADAILKVLGVKTAIVKAVGFEDGDEFAPRRVWLREVSYPINANYYDHILSRYPDAVFRAQLNRNPENPVAIESDGKIVGAIMAIRM